MKPKGIEIYCGIRTHFWKFGIREQDEFVSYCHQRFQSLLQRIQKNECLCCHKEELCTLVRRGQIFIPWVTSICSAIIIIAVHHHHHQFPATEPRLSRSSWLELEVRARKVHTEVPGGLDAGAAGATLLLSP